MVSHIGRKPGAVRELLKMPEARRMVQKIKIDLKGRGSKGNGERDETGNIPIRYKSKGKVPRETS